MKNMLVTGGAGFIGSNFIRYLLKVEPKIRIINLDALTYAGSKENLKELTSPNRHIFVQGNICNRDLLYKLLQRYQIDTVVHFAAETHVDRSILGPGQFIETNIMGTFTLLETAREYWLDKKGVPVDTARFHHISTDEVFGSLGKDDPAWTEETPYAPNSPYAASKASSDHLVRSYGHTYGLPITLTNCSNNYGPYQFPEKLIPLMILNALESKPLPVYGDGQQIRDWLHVEDHCEAIHLVLTQGKDGSMFNIGGNNQPTNLTIVETICDILDEFKPREDGAHAGAPPPRFSSVWPDQFIFDHKVRFVGEGVAAVAAVSEEIADAALELIDVEYKLLPAVFDVIEAMQPDAPKIHDTEQNLMMPPVVEERGDIDQGFAEADYIFEGEYSTGRPVPCYMEPNACVCQFDPNGKLTIWSSTQAIFMVRGILSEVLDMPVNHIRVVVENMGGGFGAKQDLFQHEFICALLAKQAGRPVRMEYSRAETFLAGRTRHPVKVYLKQGVKKDGTITARAARYLANTGAYGSHGNGIPRVGASALTSLYRCDNVRVEGLSVYTNNPIAGAFRGYGAVQAYFALDSQMDEIAHQLGLDPVELRLKNAAGDGDIAPSGHPLIGNSLAACLRRGAAETNWFERKKPATSAGPLKRGWGVGTEMHGCSAYPGIQEEGNAIVRMNEDGTVNLYTGAAELGTGAHTTLAQIVAEELGVPFDFVRCVTGDTDVTPFDNGAYASRTTFLDGGAAKQAAGEVKKQLLELASDKLEVAVEDLVIQGGQISVKGVPERTISVKDVVKGEGGTPPQTLVATATFKSTKAYSTAAHFAEVEVDTETGQVRVLQVVAVHEIGKAINPLGVEGQIEGGIQQGIGHSLTEDLIVDQQTGRPLNAGFVDYKMLLSLDMPRIKPVILEEAPDPKGPFGAKGVGEDPIIAIAPAIANAVYDAIGVRIRDLPITPEKVLQALKEKTE